MTVDLILQILLSVLTLSSVFLLLWSVFRYPMPSEPPVHRQVAMAMRMQQKSTLFEVPVLSKPMALLLGAARFLSVPSIRQRVRQDLDGSGNPYGYSVQEYLAICLLFALVTPLVAALVLYLMVGSAMPMVALLMIPVGFFVPMSLLRQAAAARVYRIGVDLPYTLDLISLMMTAGATFSEAIETLISDNPESDLNQELRLVQAEISLGTSRELALRHMADRIPLDSLRSIVGAVNQSESLGTPLSEILKNQSDTLRTQRSVRAEKIAASASLRLLVPSMLILIAVVIVVFGPFIVRFLEGQLFSV